MRVSAVSSFTTLICQCALAGRLVITYGTVCCDLDDIFTTVKGNNVVLAPCPQLLSNWSYNSPGPREPQRLGRVLGACTIAAYDCVIMRFNGYFSQSATDDPLYLLRLLRALHAFPVALALDRFRSLSSACARQLEVLVLGATLEDNHARTLRICSLLVHPSTDNYSTTPVPPGPWPEIAVIVAPVFRFLSPCGDGSGTHTLAPLFGLPVPGGRLPRVVARPEAFTCFLQWPRPSCTSMPVRRRRRRASNGAVLTDAVRSPRSKGVRDLACRAHIRRRGRLPEAGRARAPVPVQPGRRPIRIRAAHQVRRCSSRRSLFACTSRLPARRHVC